MGETSDEDDVLEYYRRSAEIQGMTSDDRNRVIRAFYLASETDRIRLVQLLEKNEDLEEIGDLITRILVSDTQPDHRVYQSAGEVHNVFIGSATGTVQANHTENVKIGLAERRQKFHFEFLKHALKQAEWTFRLSVYFMTGGAAVILVGAVLALVHAGSPNHGYVPLVTGLTGVLITTGGGALALHSKRAMANLTKAAERIEDKIDADHQLETATTFIDRVQDKDAKDRLNAAAAMKALNMQANQTMVNRLLPGDQAKEIEPGDTAE
ncbi:hypothetical protein [Streptomyces sp. SUK 48]|uniref:TRADD-N-associated membrane domain-containing protein n=1 Tax=Streptomyces sp. SUK 48 TaxID=2582831 RepID=UPI001FBA28B4|nr:hypothetical protein [Streptomyces sp. SUK 48]